MAGDAVRLVDQRTGPECERSPTAAHHWVHVKREWWVCRYCLIWTDSFMLSWPGERPASDVNTHDEVIREYMRRIGHNGLEDSDKTEC